MNRGPQLGVRILFGLTLLFFAIQLLAIAVLKAEPYPALTMPSFAGDPSDGGWIEKEVAVAHVQFTDGRTETVPLEDLLPPTKTLTGHVLRAFTDGTFVEEPETLAWLQGRIAETFPTEKPLSAVIEWKTARYGVDKDKSTRVSPLKLIYVDFGGQA